MHMWFTLAQDVKQGATVCVCESPEWCFRWAAHYYQRGCVDRKLARALVCSCRCEYVCERGRFWTANHSSRIWYFHLLCGTHVSVWVLQSITNPVSVLSVCCSLNVRFLTLRAEQWLCSTTCCPPHSTALWCIVYNGKNTSTWNFHLLFSLCHQVKGFFLFISCYSSSRQQARLKSKIVSSDALSSQKV